MGPSNWCNCIIFREENTEVKRLFLLLKASNGANERQTTGAIQTTARTLRTCQSPEGGSI
jgi:hypothetical protein